MAPKNNITRKGFIRNSAGAIAGAALARPATNFIGSSPSSSQDQWKFVSAPDFTNIDVNFPEPKWDGALDYHLGAIRGENPDFLLVAGDLVMGRWWRTKEQVKYMADIYYSAWVKRMERHGLKYYAAVGDHDMGDNPWYPKGKKKKRWMGTWDCAPIEFVPLYRENFRKYLKMPENGPKSNKRLAYYIEHKNALIVTLNVFSPGGLVANPWSAVVDQEQLQWLDSLLAKRKNKKFKIIQAHTPVLGPVRVPNSSGMMIRGGRKSKLWQIMKKHDVDLYLCGEVHDMTAIQKIISRNLPTVLYLDTISLLIIW